MNKFFIISLSILLLLSCSRKPNLVGGVEYYSYQVKKGFKLPKSINESSGLDTYENKIYTLNDSGGDPLIYVLNKKGKLIDTIVIKDAVNRDWESLDIDNGLLAIGDIGNNMGNRQDLSIYTVDLNHLDKKPEKYRFVYSSQDHFNYDNHTTPYDCEALFSADDKHYLISKNWTNRKSSLYQLEEIYETEKVTELESFNFGMLVTGADYNEELKILACSGYENYEMYVFLFMDAVPGNFFGGRVIKVHIDNLYGAQVEGICFENNNKLLLSTEETKTFNEQVWTLSLKKILRKSN